MEQESKITVDAILFDLDGTLIDSTPGVIYAWDEFRKQYTHLPDDVAHLTHGRRLAETLQEYCRITDPEELEKEIMRFELLVSDGGNGQGPQVLSGAQKLLNQLNEVAPDKWTIVTSASRFYASLAIRKCSLPVPQKGYVTSNDVSEGKPKPGPYIAGATTLSISPEKCLVVEDAPSGLKAGRAAGARTLAVCTSHQRETLLKAADGSLDYIVQNLEEVSVSVVEDQLEVTLSTALRTNTGTSTNFSGFIPDSNPEEEMALVEKGKANSNITTVQVHSNDLEDSSKSPPWQPSESASNSGAGASQAANQRYLRSPRTRLLSVGKRKFIPDSEVEGDEMIENRMEVDSAVDATSNIPTTVPTAISVTIMGDTQPSAAKKAKKEQHGKSQVESSIAVASINTPEHKPRSDYQNSDLPVAADYKWTNSFMDTVVLWAGGQPNIWSIPDETLVAALREIFATVYPDVRYEVTVHSAVFGVAWQRLLEWRSGFGSTALVMILHFFWEAVKGDTDLKAPIKTVREIAGHFISPPHFPFTRENCDEPNPARNFRSDFILKLVATAHLNKTMSAVDVESLETARLRKGYGMECVIALAAAALERAFTLLRDGAIDAQDAVQEMAEKGNITLSKKLYEKTAMFSACNWGSETQSYAYAIAKKGPDNTADIITSAYALLDHAPSNFIPSETDKVDPRALL